MTAPPEFDAVVVGSGPNGLAAAIALAQKGLKVVVYETKPDPGGGSRSADLTIPGFTHDVCAAVFPLAAGPSYLASLPLQQYGLEWIFPPVAAAHPFDDGSVAALSRSLEATAATLGSDAGAYLRLMRPLADDWLQLAPDLLGPLRFPRHPIKMARFGLHGIKSAEALVSRWFGRMRARGLFAGLAAHSMLPLEDSFSSAVGLVLAASAHAVGWPVPRGGAGQVAGALVKYLGTLGGEVRTNHDISSLEKIPPSRAVLLDITPRQFLRIAGDRLPDQYRVELEKFRYGPGAFKVDWALSGPIPFRNEVTQKASTVHIGGSFEEIAEAERLVWQGGHPEEPFVLLTQPSRFDKTRAPEGHHTAWAYCHVPNGSTLDMTNRIEEQVERFAPGFRDLILARHSMTAAALELYNPNYVGGDINGGTQSGQLFARPVSRRSPYATPLPGVFLCSSSTPPGGGVHGMCGYHAARAALKQVFRL